VEEGAGKPKQRPFRKNPADKRFSFLKKIALGNSSKVQDMLIYFYAVLCEIIEQ
jgi:hypothetical protein